MMWDDKPVTLAAGSPFEFGITIQVPPGHYLYAEDTEVEFSALEGVIITDIHYPNPTPKEDPYIDKVVDVYQGDVRIVVKGHVPQGLDLGEHELMAIVRFKGCSEKICFRPEERSVSFVIKVEGAAGAKQLAEKPAEHAGHRGEMTAVESAVSLLPSKFSELLKASDFSLILNRGFGLAILIVFLAGILTSLTPCVWPIIPAVLLFVGVHPHKRFWQNLLLAAMLTLGLVLVYSALGVAAIAFGRNIGFLFQHKWFLALVVLFFLAMSLSMFGAFDVTLPRVWRQKMHRLGGEGYLGAFLAGLGLGLVASPCAGPVLAALLGYIALQQNYPLGFLLILIYSLGFGLLFIILGSCYGELAGKLRSGPWMLWIRRVLGVMLLFPAAFYIGSLFDWSSRSSIDRPRVEWVLVEDDALKFAANEGRPIMMEFTAEWCPPCRKLDRSFFSREDIVKLSYRLVPMRVDATIETRDVRRLLEEHRVLGMPAIIFLDFKGRPYDDLRISDYEPAKIEANMIEAIKRSGKWKN